MRPFLLVCLTVVCGVAWAAEQKPLSGDFDPNAAPPPAPVEEAPPPPPVEEPPVEEPPMDEDEGAEEEYDYEGVATVEPVGGAEPAGEPEESAPAGGGEPETAGEPVAGPCPANTPIEWATKSVFDELNVADIGKIDKKTLPKANHCGMSQVPGMKEKLPRGTLDPPDPSEPEQAQALGEIINTMSFKKIDSMGPAWLDIVPYLPEGTWASLSDEALDAMPWQGMVANFDASIWGKMPYSAFNRIPDRFHQNVPLNVWQAMKPEAISQIDTKKLQLIRPAFLQQLNDSGHFAPMPKSKLESLGLAAKRRKSFRLRANRRQRQ